MKGHEVVPRGLWVTEGQVREVCADRYALTIKYTISRISALDSNKAIHLSKIILQSLLLVFALIPTESKEIRVVSIIGDKL